VDLCSRLRSCCLALVFALNAVLVTGASAATIDVTYGLLYQGVGPSGNATTLSRNVITNTPLGLGNANREIGTPRLGRAYGLGPLDAFSPSSIVLSFSECGGVICDGPVSIKSMKINEQFVVSVVQTDLYIELPGGGTASGFLTGSTISFPFAQTNWTTVGGVNCTSLCSFGGLANGWNSQSGVKTQPLGNFVFGAGGPQGGAGFTTSFVTENSSRALVTTHLATQELSRVLVPEPGTAALLAVGLAAIAWRRRAATQ
jgi:hypothetical protein